MEILATAEQLSTNLIGITTHCHLWNLKTKPQLETIPNFKTY
jgi:hypothetical protein